MPEFSSYAKINIGLKIAAPRPDGYHIIHTVFQEISLKDTIRIKPTAGKFHFSCNHPDVPEDETNLCVRAWDIINKDVGDLPSVNIELVKNIPVAAGLGGGSSNAATVLIGINQLFELGLEDQHLENIAVQLGADVPFFIKGGIQYATEIGDKLAPAQLPEIGAIVLVVPPTRISTAWAYEEAIKFLPEGYSTGKFAAASRTYQDWKFFENDFEPLVFQTYPEIGTIKARLLKSGAVFAGLSGSGSTVFGIFEEEVDAREVLSIFSSPLLTFLTYPQQR
ncbi:MAG: 4-(cytidine 5'-diphospho)-2-C-methyl-D-erythritol kinase [Fidelibacterota bacterium]